MLRIRKINSFNILLFLGMLLWHSLSNASCIGVGCSCTTVAASVAFGTYDSTSNSDVTGNVQVTCTVLVAGLNVSYTITLDDGNQNSFTPRKMISGANLLNYNLYTDSTRTQIWGDGTSGTQIVSDSYLLALFSQTRNYTVYGRVPAAQNQPAGTYSDSILVTVNY